MSDEKKVPEVCNHCKSKNVIHQVWGRTEFYSCKDCKNEVTYVEPQKNDIWNYQTWNPKDYGFSSTDFSTPYQLPLGFDDSDTDDSGGVPF